MSGTCKGCRHWERMTEPLEGAHDYGKCRRINSENVRVEGEYRGHVGPGTGKMAHVAGPGAFLVTMDGFSCNQFEDEIGEVFR